MKKNPYEILGISENSTDEQVKEAYRNLAKKYHSDNYSGGPLSEIARRKMEGIDDAYDTIMLTRRGTAGAGNSGYGNSNAHGKSYYKAGSQFSDIREKINARRIEDAETLLDGVPELSRDAEWYYLKGMVQHHRGWFDAAEKSYSRACDMDPDNLEYRSAYNNINGGRSGGYKTYNGRTRRQGSCNTCDICTGLLCADCCCECIGCDCIPCC